MYPYPFSKIEAQWKIGRQVRMRREFPGVPIWTTGKVVSICESAFGEPGVIVKWDSPYQSQAFSTDQFSKSEYDYFLFEL